MPFKPNQSHILRHGHTNLQKKKKKNYFAYFEDGNLKKRF